MMKKFLPLQRADSFDNFFFKFINRFQVILRLRFPLIEHRIPPRVIFLSIRSILVLTKSAYFGFILPDSNKLSNNSIRIPDATAQASKAILKENPIGSENFDTF